MKNSQKENIYNARINIAYNKIKTLIFRDIVINKLQKILYTIVKSILRIINYKFAVILIAT